MFTKFGMYVILITIVYISIAYADLEISTNMEEENQNKSPRNSLGRFSVDPNYLWTNRMYYTNNANTDLGYGRKRQSKKKWVKFGSGPQSSYTIAFPALIRTRRSMGQ